jgi:2-oxo-3-hexenedioate decarboxylase
MTLTPEEVSSEASRLLAAADAARTTALPSLLYPALTIGEGYAIQDEGVIQRVERGDRVIGAKLGLTSRAKQEAMGIDEVAVGTVLAGTLEAADGEIGLGAYIHPRVEPEIVFRMKTALAGPGVGVSEALAATAAVGCGFEVIDSRFDDFRFTLADAVADNTSAAGVVLGSTWVAPYEVADLSRTEVLLEADGEEIAAATGAAVLGHPAAAVAALANWLGQRGRMIEPGWLVLSGGITDAAPLVPGRRFVASFGRLGSVSVHGVE